MTYRMSIALPEWSRDFLETYRAANGLRSLNAAVVRLVENEQDRQLDAEAMRRGFSQAIKEAAK